MWAPAAPPNVRGLGKVNVRLNSTTLDIFSTISAFYWHFSGISMVGGRVQLLIGNNNNDQAQNQGETDRGFRGLT
jgi:hypothetical protein